MEHYFVGALGYADDLILLSPIVYGLEVKIIMILTSKPYTIGMSSIRSSAYPRAPTK